ncbi:MAG: chemotaxis protein CheX [SAR324 cluster bacterium]|nr:chemotaxis protein CheX [SAR324 cluster bacterium]
MKKYISPFLAATLEVLSTMANTPARPGNPLKRDPKPADGVISAIIDMTGGTNGSISITFSESCIVQVVNNMLGESYTEMNDQIQDAVGELVNMISGAARKRLEANGFRFTAGIPHTVTGEGHTIDHSVQGAVVVIPFKTEGGLFYVEACFTDSN